MLLLESNFMTQIKDDNVRLGGASDKRFPNRASFLHQRLLLFSSAHCSKNRARTLHCMVLYSSFGSSSILFNTHTDYYIRGCISKLYYQRNSLGLH